MIIGNYIPAWVMIIILVLSLVRWFSSIAQSGDYRGISAITSRLYLLYTYIAIIILELDQETICFILSLGLGAVLLDEGVYWFTTRLACIVNKFKSKKVNKWIQKS